MVRAAPGIRTRRAARCAPASGRQHRDLAAQLQQRVERRGTRCVVVGSRSSRRQPEPRLGGQHGADAGVLGEPDIVERAGDRSRSSSPVSLGQRVVVRGNITPNGSVENRHVIEVEENCSAGWRDRNPSRRRAPRARSCPSPGHRPRW